MRNKPNYLIKVFNPITNVEKSLKIYESSIKKVKIKADTFYELCSNDGFNLIIIFNLERRNEFLIKIGKKWIYKFKVIT